MTTSVSASVDPPGQVWQHDIYIPDLHIESVKVKVHDFRQAASHGNKPIARIVRKEIQSQDRQSTQAKSDD